MRRASIVLLILGLLAAAAARGSPDRWSGAPCRGSELSGRLHQSTGAAGTIALSIVVRNTGPSYCSLLGFPRLQIIGRRGALPTRVVHGGLAFLNRTAHRLFLAPTRPRRS